MPIERAGRIIREGGVVAYPTEGVFGFGCLPDEPRAVLRILAIKRRDPTRGLILIAARAGQFDGWIAPHVDSNRLAPSDDHPVTFIVPAEPGVPLWVRGSDDTLAVRVTTHPVAAALCRAARSPLVSTSANLAGRPPARNALVLRRQFRRVVDCIVPGRTGTHDGPSEIRDLESGEVLRPAPS